MKFGANLLIWLAAFEEEHLALLPRIKAQGFDGVEIPVFNPAVTPVEIIRRGLADNGLEATTCSAMPSGAILFSENPAERQKALDHLKSCIEVNAAIGSKIFAGPFFSPVGYLPGRRRTAAEWARGIEGMIELGDTLQRHDVRMAIEPLNRFETFFLNTVEDAVTLCDAVNHPNIGILYDTFHANIEEKDPVAALPACGRHLFHIHTCENDRGIPGTGHVPWQATFDAIRAVKYDGWLTIESFGYNIADIAAAAAIWRDIAPSPESIAFEGLPFIRRMAAQ